MYQLIPKLENNKLFFKSSLHFSSPISESWVIFGWFLPYYYDPVGILWKLWSVTWSIDLFSLGCLLPHFRPCDGALENSCSPIFKLLRVYELIILRCIKVQFSRDSCSQPQEVKVGDISNLIACFLLTLNSLWERAQHISPCSWF